MSIGSMLSGGFNAILPAASELMEGFGKNMARETASSMSSGRLVATMTQLVQDAKIGVDNSGNLTKEALEAITKPLSGEDWAKVRFDPDMIKTRINEVGSQLNYDAAANASLGDAVFEKVGIDVNRAKAARVYNKSFMGSEAGQALSAEEVAAMKGAVNSYYQDMVDAGGAGKVQAMADGFINSYFSTPGKTKARVGMVGGAAVGARYLTGGDLTHDKYGQSNIVGVPFI